MTVGDLRTLLAGFPDELIVRVVGAGMYGDGEKEARLVAQVNGGPDGAPGGVLIGSDVPSRYSATQIVKVFRAHRPERA